MNQRLEQLAASIRNELTEVQRVLGRIEEGWRRARSSADDYYLDAVALNLHGFYGGLERIFERIATVVDGARPSGEHWHQALLQQMAEEVPGVRPAVISASTRTKLDEFRSFRHVARNVYTFHLDPARLERLASGAALGFDSVKPELLAFAEFLEQQAGSG
ncbi:MAG: hypothetical protein JW993_03475 [Sedimentisphaerales bacterium]|nr:hypothetical protein [Sedimentisphaerales bacterium]